MGKRLWLFMFVFVVGAAALGTAALASPPDHFTDSFDYSGSTSCGPFEDVYQGHLEFSGITKFDKQGNRVADVYHVSGWETNWRSDRPDTVITAKREADEVLDYATGTRRESGIIYKQTAPGHAILFHDVGNVTFNDATGEVISVHGPHDVLEQGDTAFCNALLAI